MGTVAVGVAVAVGGGVALVGSVAARGLARSSSASVRLQDVSALSASDVWAVGSTQRESEEPAIVHWDGHALSPVSTNLDSGSPGEIVPGQLSGVSAESATDAWAVGTMSPRRSHMFQSLVLRWDGSRWSRVASPNPSPVSNYLQAVKANTPEDVWAEGQYLDLRNHQHRLFVIHWDGSRWSTVQLPAYVARQVQLFGFRSFDPVGARSAFALALHVAPNGIRSDQVLHWNGRSWSKTLPFYGAGFSGIGASSAGDVWAVGYNCVLRRCPPFHTATYHWDGRHWKGGVFYKRGDPFTGHEVIPSPSEDNSKLVSVTDHTPSDVWATGTCSGPCPHGHTYVLHWNGRAWSQLPYPGARVSSAISPVSANDAWVVGGGALLHWDGSSWSRK
jgi:hypothetical protein